MPFDQSHATHMFLSSTTGGAIEIVVRDLNQRQSIWCVRTLEEAARFARGDYSDPAYIHGAAMPGLSRCRGRVPRRVRYLETPAGAAITFATADSDLVTAIHAWLTAQEQDNNGPSPPFELGRTEDRVTITDILSNRIVAGTVFGSLRSSLLGGFLDINQGSRTAVWVVALTIGVACVDNAIVLAGTLLCYGAIFLVGGSRRDFYMVSACCPLGKHGWNVIGLAVLVGAIVLSCLPEVFLGSYGSRRASVIRVSADLDDARHIVTDAETVAETVFVNDAARIVIDVDTSARIIGSANSVETRSMAEDGIAAQRKWPRRRCRLACSPDNPERRGESIDAHEVP